ncbi:hypothetical protein P3S67_010917 [Capsicum chacoense]
MARGRGRGHESTGRVGKSVVKSNPDVTANIPTIPTSTIISPQAGVNPQADGMGGQNDTNQVQPLIPQITSTFQTFGDGSNPTTPESSSTAPNQINITAESAYTLRNQIGCYMGFQNYNMNRGRGIGRGSVGRVGKSAARSNILVLTANMPTISTPTATPQATGDIGGPTSNHGSNPTTPESSPTSPNQSNPIVLGMSSQTNQVGEDVSRSNINGESNSSRIYVRTLVTITSADKHFYWDSSISDAAVKKQWQIKAAIVYRNFISKLKNKGISQDFRHEDVWESWQRLWEDPKCVEKSKINAQNHRGGKEVAVGTNTGGSISIGEYQKRLVTMLKTSFLQAAEIGRYPTPSEKDMKKYYEKKIFSESDIDQIEEYYQIFGGEKKRRVFGLGSEAKGYYGQTLCVSCGKTSSSA